MFPTLKYPYFQYILISTCKGVCLYFFYFFLAAVLNIVYMGLELFKYSMIQESGYSPCTRHILYGQAGRNCIAARSRFKLHFQETRPSLFPFYYSGLLSAIPAPWGMVFKWLFRTTDSQPAKYSSNILGSYALTCIQLLFWGGDVESTAAQLF